MSRLFMFSGLSLFLTLAACGSKDNHDAEAAEASHAHAEDEIIIEPGDAARFDLEVESAVSAPFAQSVRAMGEVLPSVSARSVATAPASGVVTLDPAVAEGTQIKSGMKLGRIIADRVEGGSASKAARAAVDAARREVERLRPLLDDALVTKKEYNDAVASLRAAEAAISSVAETGVVTAPRSGVISRLLVSDGQYLAAGAPVAEISGSGRLTLRALLPVSEGAFLPMINDATIVSHSGDALRLSDMGGRLESAAAVSASTYAGYIPVYFTFDGHDPSVVPGSAVEVYLSGSPGASVITVPREAIIEQMGERFVFVRASDHGYEKRHVTIGGTDGRRVAITSGVCEGDSVVVRGATFVRLAEQSAVVPEGHSHTH